MGWGRVPYWFMLTKLFYKHRYTWVGLILIGWESHGKKKTVTKSKCTEVTVSRHVWASHGDLWPSICCEIVGVVDVLLSFPFLCISCVVKGSELTGEVRRSDFTAERSVCSVIFLVWWGRILVLPRVPRQTFLHLVNEVDEVTPGEGGDWAMSFSCLDQGQGIYSYTEMRGKM